MINKTPRKFVCFDGIEGKELANELAREKGERKKENRKRKRKKELSSVWNVRECKVVGKKTKGGNKEKKKVRAHVWRKW